MPMTLLANGPAVWTVTLLALAAAGGLLALEWRRPDRRRRAWRLGATVLAVGALVLLVLRPAWRGHLPGKPPAGNTAAALWTPAATAALPGPGGIERRYRFALPGAAVPAAVEATVVPDVAAWRRRFPQIGRLHVLGDGLEAFDLGALAGLQVDFTPTPFTAAAGAAVSFLHCPRVLPLGEPLIVEGRLGGLPAGGTATLTLEAPDGTTTSANTPGADDHGEVGFRVASAPPPATGRFLWRLRLREPGENARVLADEPLAVAVIAPALPRMLVLESAPRFDTARLRRWYESAGGTLRARVRLGQERYRFFGATTAEFNALDAALLGGFDLVLADARALAALPPPEREALQTAVAGTGLGVLILADDAVLPPAVVAPDRAWLLPWRLRPVGGNEVGPPIPADPHGAAAPADGTEHLARIRWAGMAQPADLPLPTAPFEIAAQPGQTGVVRDDQGRVLAAVAGWGRGRLALTLVRETARWQRGDDPGAFAGYWSFLLTQVARRLEFPGRWTLADGDGGPVFVDQPLELVWSGPGADPAPRETHVTDASDAVPVALAPGGDPAEPGRWRVTFWPRRPGWHRVETAANGGGGLDFYVAPAGDWPALAAARRRSATARFAAQSAAGPSAPTVPSAREDAPISAGWWFAVFCLGAGFLWIERRLAA